MDCNIEALIPHGVDVRTGMDYTGSREKYVLALGRYRKAHEANRQRITDDLAAEDIEDYAIIVHSLKSNSRMIGAASLAGEFEALEHAARAGDASAIRRDTPGVLARYDALVRELAPFDAESGPAAAARISSSEASEIAEDLLAALEDFDDDGSLELVNRLSGYPFDEEGRELLKRAAGYIGEFMYDEAADLIRQLCGVGFGEVS